MKIKNLFRDMVLEVLAYYQLGTVTFRPLLRQQIMAGMCDREKLPSSTS
jgi:hypothetical protein